MTDLAIREPYQPDRIIQRSGGVYERDIIDGWVQVMSDVAKLADYISETDFVPKSLRNKPAAIAACILTGRELGIGPMQSLKSIYMVQGVPSLSAEYKRARALAAGHEISIDETNGTRCIIRGRRAGTERWVTITWTLDMARRAKLATKDIWQAYPQRMLQARASGELCDLIFPDASLGLATTEVLEDGGIVALESGEMVDAATGELTTGTAAAIEPPKPRTAQRAARKAAPPAERSQCPEALHDPEDGSLSRCQLPGGHEGRHKSGVITWGGPPAGAPADPALPPLPGEDEPPPPVSLLQDGQPDPSPLIGAEPVTNKQLAAIWTALTKDFSFTDDEKDLARAACGSISGRGPGLPSTKELTKADAGTVIDTLAHLKAQAEKQGEHPRSLLIALLAQREEGEVPGE